jgi:hypothetical protein
MSALIYTWDRLHSALLTLTLGDKPARERLLDAVTVTTQLDVILVDPHIDGMPEEPLERITHLHCQSSGVSTPQILGNSAPVIYGNDAPHLGRMQTNFGRYQMSLS